MHVQLMSAQRGKELGEWWQEESLANRKPTHDFSIQSFELSPFSHNINDKLWLHEYEPPFGGYG